MKWTATDKYPLCPIWLSVTFLFRPQITVTANHICAILARCLGYALRASLDMTDFPVTFLSYVCERSEQM